MPYLVKSSPPLPISLHHSRTHISMQIAITTHMQGVICGSLEGPEAWVLIHLQQSVSR